MSALPKKACCATLLLLFTCLPAMASCPDDRFFDITDFSHADFEAAQSNDKFGLVVATNGDIIAVGQPQNDHASEIGSVYLFQRNRTTGNWTFLRKLSEPGFAEAGDRFGATVTMHGNTLAVGAPRAGDTAANDAGAVYIFHRNQGGANAWGLHQTLYVNPADGYKFFGATIAIDHNRMLIGDSRFGSPSIGRVGVFERNNENGSFHEVAALLAPAADQPTSNSFASQVALEGDIAVVGDPTSSYAAEVNLPGRVYVYYRNPGNGQWNLVKRLARPTGITGFGTALGLAKGRIAVGTGNTELGHVFLFERHAGGTDQWGQVADLTAGADSSTIDGFGNALHLSGMELVVGAEGAFGTASSTGAAYVFRRDEGGPNQWGQVQKLFSQTNNGRSNYGTVLDWAAGVAVIGDPMSDHPDHSAGARIGRVYVHYNDVIFCDSFQ